MVTDGVVIGGGLVGTRTKPPRSETSALARELEKFHLPAPTRIVPFSVDHEYYLRLTFPKAKGKGPTLAQAITISDLAKGMGVGELLTVDEANIEARNYRRADFAFSEALGAHMWSPIRDHAAERRESGSCIGCDYLTRLYVASVQPNEHAPLMILKELKTVTTIRRARALKRP